MRIVSKFSRRIKFFMLIAATLSLSSIPASSAYAVSEYDDFIHTPTQLKIGYPGFDNLDMTNQYMGYVLGTITSGVEYNNCSDDCKNLIFESLSNGDWAINQLYSNYPSDQYQIFLNFCNGKMNETTFAHYYIGSMRMDMLNGSSTSPIDCVSVNISYQPTNSQNHIFITSTVGSDLTYGALSVAGKAKSGTTISYYSMPYVYTASDTISVDGYEGENVAGEKDSDADGLNNTQEQFQDTSDTDLDKDTDNDGLSDFTESIWNPDRDDIFCKVGTTSKVCTYPNPVKKDIYIEVDWMDNGTHEYKPSTTQLGLVTGMFANKNIIVHFDTGQYGGGKKLDTYTQYLRTAKVAGNISFGDYKDGGEGESANFASNRNNIWHYMIYGDEYINNSRDGELYSIVPSGRSGVAETGGDDLFIAGNITENASGVESVDLAVASTIAHELGHNLCLTRNLPSGSNLPSECEYGAIDNTLSEPVNYKSVMNYRYQLTKEYIGRVDYSDGTNGTTLAPDDHDDWSAVMLGMSSFSGNAVTDLGSRSNTQTNRAMDSNLIMND